MAENDIILPSALPAQVKLRNVPSFQTTGTLEDILAAVEKKVLQSYLEEESDKIQIAKQLGLSRSTLYEKIKKHNL